MVERMPSLPLPPSRPSQPRADMPPARTEEAVDASASGTGTGSPGSSGMGDGTGAGTGADARIRLLVVQALSARQVLLGPDAGGPATVTLGMPLKR